MKVKLTCEECGVIGELEGDEDTLHARAEELIEGHWEDAHPYPNVHYDWTAEGEHSDGSEGS